MEITEKVAYLKGLMEGMKIDTETNEGKILSAMVDILEDIGLELEDLWNAQGELEDGLDVVSDDLEDIEDIVYDEESFDDEYYEDDAGNRAGTGTDYVVDIMEGQCYKAVRVKEDAAAQETAQDPWSTLTLQNINSGEKTE